MDRLQTEGIKVTVNLIQFCGKNNLTVTLILKIGIPSPELVDDFPLEVGIPAVAVTFPAAP